MHLGWLLGAPRSLPVSVGTCARPSTSPALRLAPSRSLTCTSRISAADIGVIWLWEFRGQGVRGLLPRAASHFARRREAALCRLCEAGFTSLPSPSSASVQTRQAPALLPPHSSRLLLSYPFLKSLPASSYLPFRTSIPAAPHLPHLPTAPLTCNVTRTTGTWWP